MIQIIKESFDIQVYHPVASPALLSGFSNRIMSASRYSSIQFTISMESKNISQEVKEKLNGYYKSSNPVWLRKNIEKSLNRIYELS